MTVLFSPGVPELYYSQFLIKQRRQREVKTFVLCPSEKSWENNVRSWIRLISRADKCCLRCLKVWDRDLGCVSFETECKYTCLEEIDWCLIETLCFCKVQNSFCPILKEVLCMGSEVVDTLHSNVQPELPLQNSPACSDASAQTPGFLVQQVFLPTRKMGKFEQKLLQMRMSINYLTNSKNISSAAEKLLPLRYVTVTHSLNQPAASALPLLPLIINNWSL